MWLGYLHAGARGALAVAFPFVLPPFLLVTAVAVFYAKYQGLSWVHAVFLGVGVGGGGRRDRRRRDRNRRPGDRRRDRSRSRSSRWRRCSSRAFKFPNPQSSRWPHSPAWSPSAERVERQ
jgi:hypothetical protein